LGKKADQFEATAGQQLIKKKNVWNSNNENSKALNRNVT